MRVGEQVKDGTPAVSPRSKYSEIEGLRGIAATLVAVFHIWIGGVSGGVDVFFVVSGFLITRTLLGHIGRWGEVRIGYFLRRLLRRLLPTAFIVLAATAVVAVVVLPQQQWRALGEQLVASLLYVENWYLGFTAVDYNAADQSRSFLQHFWALSIQMQFYLLWAVVFAGLVVLCRYSRLSITRSLVVGVAGLVALSFVLSLVLTAVNPQFTYFNPAARVWEFGMGGLVALLGSKVRLSGGGVAAALSWVALGALGLTGLIATTLGASFPGWIAAVPVLSATLLLASVDNAGAHSAHRLLRLRPLVWLGGISYAFYLWHWPVLVATNYVLGGERGALGGGAVIVLSIILAWVTTRFLEWLQGSRTFVVGVSGRVITRAATVALGSVVVVAGVALIALSPSALTAEEKAEQEAILSDTATCWGARALDSRAICEEHPSDVVLPFGDPALDLAAVHTPACNVGNGSDALVPCQWVTSDPTVRVALIGNSHAGSWFPALMRIAQEQGWQVDTYMKDACAFNTTYRANGNDEWEQSCVSWNEKLSASLAAAPAYDFVMTSASAGNARFVASDGSISLDAGVRGYEDVWRPLVERGTAVIVMRDYPRGSEEAIVCSQRDPNGSCGRELDGEALPDVSRDAIASAALGTRGVELVDMTQWFCRDGFCPSLIGGVHVYRDPGHLTSAYAYSLGPYLEAELRDVDAVERLFTVP